MNGRLSKMINSPLKQPILIGVVAFNAGVALGYFLGLRKRNETHNFEDQLKLRLVTEELNKIKDGSKQKNTKVIIQNEPKTDTLEKFFTPPIVSPKLVVGKEFITDIIKPVVDDELDDEPLIRKSIFDDDDWNWELEARRRSDAAPYILHKDEFYSNEKEYTQVTLTYYAGDDILVDEDDSPIYNHEQITGPLTFGHGSGDPNVVYIRNDRRKAEYEVLFDPGLYSVEVLGLEIENNTRVRDLKHSKNKKFREE